MTANCFTCDFNYLAGAGPCDQHAKQPDTRPVHPLFEQILENHQHHDTRHTPGDDQ